MGENIGLWAHLDDARDEVSRLKTCCAAQRSNLAWKNVTDDVKEVRHMIRKLNSISSFFRCASIP